MARILFVGVLAIAAVLVVSAVLVALAPYVAAAAVVIVMFMWFDRGSSTTNEIGPPEGSPKSGERPLLPNPME